tara:strand:- start:412 stop:1035 length:624 start_codon:yes stop_codon:yes gene_type:complete
MNSVKYLKTHLQDKEFVANIASKQTKDTIELVVIQRLYNNEAILTEIQNISLPIIDDKDCMIKEDVMKLSLTYLDNILKYCIDILDISETNVDLQYVIKSLLNDLIIRTTNIDSVDISYSADVEQMRENDKKDKYNKKDTMSDDERLLYLMLENIGHVPDIQEFSNVFDSDRENANTNTNIPSYDAEVENENNNPEYETYVGENDDE